MHTSIFATLFSVAISSPKDLSNVGIDPDDTRLFIHKLAKGQLQLTSATEIISEGEISHSMQKSINKLIRHDSLLADFCGIRDLAIHLLRYNGLPGDPLDWRDML